MKKQKKQSLLNTLITILVIALIVMVVSIVYEEKINMSKQPTQNTAGQLDNEEDKETETNDEKTPVEENNEEETNTETDEEPATEEQPIEPEDEYVGEEESNTEDSTQSEEEKVISLVKKQWGDDDSVTFNIENKSGSKYRVSVTSQATVLQWYEVDTETWEVSEF